MADENTYRVLKLTIQYGTTDDLQKLLYQDVNPNAADKNGMTALIYAAKHNKLDQARILLDNNTDPNQADLQKDTALIWAACLGHKDMVSLLLEYDADIDATNNYGTSPLEGAKRLNRQGIAKILTAAAEKKAQRLQQTAQHKPQQKSRFSGLLRKLR